MKASLSCSCGGVVFFYGVGYLSVPAAEQSTEADFFFFPYPLAQAENGTWAAEGVWAGWGAQVLGSSVLLEVPPRTASGGPGARGTCGVRAVLGGLVCPNMLQAVTVTPLSSLLQCNSRV